MRAWLLALLMCLVWSPAVFAGAVPDTGQAQCYGLTGAIACPAAGEPFSGQDSQHPTARRSFTKLDAKGRELSGLAPAWSMVRDGVTGLVWEIKNSRDGAADFSNPHDADNLYTWYDGHDESNGGDPGVEGSGTDTSDFIGDLNSSSFGGFADWRLPTATELFWLLDLGSTSPPLIAPAYFPAVADEYWTATTDPTNAGRCATVTLLAGVMNFPAKAGSFSAMAVRGALPPQQFHDNGDGTVSDLVTGLMWQQDCRQGISWQTGLEYCRNLELGGHADWRMPDVNELISLVDYSRWLPSIDDTCFLNTTFHYWSSTTCPADPGKAYHVCFLRGRAEVHGKADAGLASNVRAVRGIISDNSSTTTTYCPVERLYGRTAAETKLLRRFRDEVLSTTGAGRMVINFYSRISPAVDRFIDGRLCYKVLREVCDSVIAGLETTGF